MSSFKLAKMTLGSLFREPETVCYPLVEKEAFEGRKGHVVNDMSQCIFCGVCVKSCPAHALAVDRNAPSWAIDYLHCVQCFSCVQTCPRQCLAMEPRLPAVAAQRGEGVHTC